MTDLYEHGFISVINDITRPSNKHDGGTCIDHIFLKSEWDNKKYISIIYQKNISDHFITFLKIENYPITNNIEKQKCVNYKKLLNLASKTNWNEISHLDDVNIAMNTLIDKVKNLVTKSEYTISHKNKKRKPWITMGLMKSCTTKDKLYKTWKNDKNNSKKSAYKRYCFHLKVLLKKASDMHKKMKH